MKYLPIENIIFKTRLKEDEIIRRLSDCIEPEKTFRFSIFSSASTKSYEGQINGSSFTINRILINQNSFRPIINGVIERDVDGLTINVKMRLHISVIYFLYIWYGGLGLGCIAALIQAFGNSAFNPITLIPFGMLIFIYAMTMGGFKYESNKSKKDLQTIFEADMIEV
jgi:hypothetical protein